MRITMIHPIKSAQARYQRWVINNYKTTRFGRVLEKYKNQYLGQRCFIVANGPSLRPDDLDLLALKHEISFGMNRIYKYFDQTVWRPTFYVCEDELIIQNQQVEINDLPAVEKFIPIELKYFHNIKVSGAKYFHINYNENDRFPYSFSTDIAKQIDCRGTVTFTCMQIAAYMGFAQIYLIGVDHNYQNTIDINGNLVHDDTVKDYFCEGYDTDIKDIAVHDMGNNTRAYLDALAYCDNTEKTKIYNATRGGKLEVFERVNFDSLFV